MSIRPERMRSAGDDAFAAACLASAGHIAARLIRTARWSGNVCTWNVVVPDATLPGRPRPSIALAGPTLYQGTAGIALFLSEFVAATGDAAAGRTARGALRHAVAEVGELGPAAFGLHTGRVGVAHALARHAALTGDGATVAEARAVLAPLFGNESRDRELDVIAGAAGAIPVLLQLAESIECPDASACAVLLGEHLVRYARHWPEGWAWGSTSGTTARDLTGLAHGAAGCAAALLELWTVTGDDAVRYAAEQAFAYETHHFDVQAGNWPDYRSLEWDQIIRTPAAAAALRATLRAGGEAPAYQRWSMVGWCHGAPGIGLTRLRAHELLRDAHYAEQARVAVHTTRAHLRAGISNYSLCHGAFGNCETIVRAADQFGEPGWRAEVVAYVSEALAAYGTSERRWPSGTVDGLPEPSLMLGEAGVGHFLLRLARPSVASILLPRAREVAREVERAGAAHGPAGEGSRRVDVAAAAARRLRAGDVDRYFGRTLRAFARLGVTLPPENEDAGSASPVVAARAVERVVVGAPNEAWGKLLADAARVDRARFEAMRELPYFVEEIAHNWRHAPAEAVPWDTARFQLSPCVRLVACERDWDGWLGIATSDRPEDAAAPPPVGAPVTYVLFRQRSEIQVHKLGGFAAAVLGAVATCSGGITVGGVANELLSPGWDSGGVEAAATVRARVVEQLRRAYDADIVTVADEVGATPPAAG